MKISEKQILYLLEAAKKFTDTIEELQKLECNVENRRVLNQVYNLLTEIYNQQSEELIEVK